MRRWLWAQGTERLSDSGTADLLDLCQRCHITDIMFLAHNSQHGALWESEMFTSSDLRVDGLPYLDYLIREAGILNINVHAWFAVGSWPWAWGMLKTGTPDWKWSQANWLDMTLPEAQAAVGDAVADISLIYNLAGVHLDYIRRPDAISNPTIQPEHVTACVQSARNATVLELTAATVPHTFGGFDILECAQDWPTWLQSDLVDIAMPMLYYNASTVDGQLNYIEGDPKIEPRDVVVGVCPTSPQGVYRSVAEWETVLDVCINRGYEFSVFDDTVLTADYQPAVEARPVKEPGGGNGMGIGGDLAAVAQALRDEAALAVEQANARAAVLNAQADALDASQVSLDDIATEAQDVAAKAQHVSESLKQPQ